ncbi:MAG: DUF1343 domain-containing protein [Spirochaetales bacterium]|nr:DUF1343 domain-containing protein [Spirochaetales bacterium]
MSSRSIVPLCLGVLIAGYSSSCCHERPAAVGAPSGEAQARPHSATAPAVPAAWPRPAEAERLVSLSRRAARPEKLRLGSDRLFDSEYLPLVAGRRVAVMANQTSRSTVDRLIDDRRVSLVAVFAPEHGFNGTAPAGDPVAAETYRGVPVYGCFGGGDETRRIPAELLAGVDVLLFEIQDLGTRHYTYVSSMYLAMDSAADTHTAFVVLDRPVAVNGAAVEGPVLEAECQSFVGVGRLPNRYGMTIGELALLFKHEAGIMDGPRYPRRTEGDAYWNVKDLALFVVPMTGYDRTLCADEQAGAPAWVPTSPNVPSVDAALCYVGAGLFDGNAVKEMVRGYEQFVYVGLPFVKDGAALVAFIAAAGRIYDFPGVALEPCVDPRTGRADVLKLAVTDRARFNPSYAALALMYAQAKEYPEVPFFSSEAGKRSFLLIAGARWLVDLFSRPAELPPFAEMIERLEKETEAFKAIRARYLLY